MSTLHAFPSPPTTTIDWARIGYESRPFNGHIECIYDEARGVWTAPTVVPEPFLRVHGLAPGLNYGQQAFEGMKAFRDSDNNVNIFRPLDHARRMNHSCSYVSIPTIPKDLFLSAVNLAVAINSEFVPPHAAKDAALYIRPLAFASGGHLPLSLCKQYTFAVFVQPLQAYHGIEATDALVLDEFDRAAPRGTGAAKLGGNYAPVLRWSEGAKAEGYGITLHLDSQTRTEIDEFSTAGFIGVKDNALVVPDSKNVIQSITSLSVVALAESMGYQVQIRPIKYTELHGFDEIIAVGTAAALVPVGSITRRSTQDRFCFPAAVATDGSSVCAKLRQRLSDIQRGDEVDAFGWLHRVQGPLRVLRPAEKEIVVMTSEVEIDPEFDTVKSPVIGIERQLLQHGVTLQTAHYWT